jgi:hypothetical protein
MDNVHDDKAVPQPIEIEPRHISLTRQRDPHRRQTIVVDGGGAAALNLTARVQWGNNTLAIYLKHDMARQLGELLLKEGGARREGLIDDRHPTSHSPDLRPLPQGSRDRRLSVGHPIWPQRSCRGPSAPRMHRPPQTQGDDGSVDGWPRASSGGAVEENLSRPLTIEDFPLLPVNSDICFGYQLAVGDAEARRRIWDHDAFRSPGSWVPADDPSAD